MLGQEVGLCDIAGNSDLPEEVCNNKFTTKVKTIDIFLPGSHGYITDSKAITTVFSQSLI